MENRSREKSDQVLVTRKGLTEIAGLMKLSPPKNHFPVYPKANNLKEGGKTMNLRRLIEILKESPLYRTMSREERKTAIKELLKYHDFSFIKRRPL